VLTRKVKGRSKPPSRRLLYTVYFSLGTVALLSALEIAHMAFLHEWNSQIFAAITGLIGTVTGVLIGQHA
jgi:hypothetical protein